MPPAPKDEPDGDIFAVEGAAKPKKKKSTKKTKGRTDDELLGNTDDIFGDIPASTGKSPKTKKKKKKTTASAPWVKGGEAVGGASEAPDGKCFIATILYGIIILFQQRPRKSNIIMHT